MPDCTAIDMDASIWLDDNTPMVRKWDNVFHKRIVCNLWGCEVEYSEQSEVKLQRCQKCREVLYCSRAHQVRRLIIFLSLQAQPSATEPGLACA
jgi:hypothetical protein